MNQQIFLIILTTNKYESLNKNLKKTTENKTEVVNKSKTIAETDRDKLDKKFSKEKSKLN